MRNISQKLCSTTHPPGFKYQMVAPLKKISINQVIEIAKNLQKSGILTTQHTLQTICTHNIYYIYLQNRICEQSKFQYTLNYQSNIQ